MEAVIIEIRSAEGGADAKDLVRIQTGIYAKYSMSKGLTFDLVECREGTTSIRISGKAVVALFRNEAGGHRFQRVPPNERKGRTHTSTITVAVLREPEQVELRLDEKDLEFKTCRGSGAGGQKRNKTESAVILTHLPTKLSVRIESERSQLMNKETARAVLRARLLEAKESASAGAYSAVRKGQVGTGMRGDKRRTVQEQNGIVVDHVRGRRTDVKSYMKGDLDWLV